MSNVSMDEALDRAGTGPFQWRLIGIFGLVWTADAMQVLATRPQLQRLVEPRLPALEPLDDALELAERRLEGRLVAHGRTSSTVAANPPEPSSTSTRAPVSTAVEEVTSASPVRTIA